jgi:tryprostatin B 6-hydroxylase
MNVTTLFSHFSFDVMGEIAFSRSFSLLQNRAAAIPKESYDAPTLISQGMSMLRFFTPVPWVARLCFVLAPYMPIITQKWNRALNWAAKVCDDRLERSVGSDQYADAFSRFIHSSYVEDDRRSFDRLALYGDAFAITVAGSHSTAATLTMLCFELARHPEAQQQARNELLAAHYHGGIDNEVDGPPSERYPFLDSCIKETLRLYPVVPTGGIRQTVAKGIHVGGRWIPPQTVIVAPRWTLGRRKDPILVSKFESYKSPFCRLTYNLVECAFDKPNEFIPERWTSKQHMVKNARVFNAFGIGSSLSPSF